MDPGKLSTISKRLDTAFRRGLEGMNAGDDDAEFPTISKLLAEKTNAMHRHHTDVAPHPGIQYFLVLVMVHSYIHS